MLKSTKAITAGVSVLAAAAVLSACGSSTVSPQQQLDNSFTGLGAKSSLTSTIRVAFSPADLSYFIATDTDDDAATKARLAKLFPTSSFAITAATNNGKALKDAGKEPKTTDAAFAFILGGKTDVEFRGIAATQTLFARADVNDIATQTGGDAAQLQSQLAQAPTSLGFVKTAAKGGWLSIDLGALQALAKQFPGATGAAGATPNPSQAAAAQAQLIDSLERDVVAKPGPSSNLGDHLILTANSKAVAGDVINAVKTALPAAVANMVTGKLNVSDVPSKNVTLDAYTKGGTLSTLQIDLAQFASGADAAKLKGHHIPLELDFTSTGAKIAAPANATAVNLQQIGQAFAGLSGGSDGSGGLGGLDGSTSSSTS